MRWQSFVSAFVVVLAFRAPAFSGDVTGSVRFEGTPPKMPRIMFAGDPSCMREHPSPVYSEEVVVNGNGTLKNVLVYIKDGPAEYTSSPPGMPVTLDQNGCMYRPHVLGLQTGQPLEVLNSDGTLHNVHIMAKLNPAMNRGEPRRGAKFEVKFDKPEIIKVKCDVHPWMSAYVGVFATPYFAVTGDDGSFTLRNLPPGQYTLEAWHERYGTRTARVSIGPKGVSKAEFVFTAR